MSDRDDITVLMLPDYSDSNPYQTALIDGLRAQEVTVRAAEVNGVAPIIRGCWKHGIPDVLHIHWIHAFITTDRRGVGILLAISCLLELLIVRILGVRIVWTVHNTVDHEAARPRVRRLFRRQVARASDRLIVHCTAALTILEDAYGLSESTMQKVRVVPHGHFIDQYPNELSGVQARDHLNVSADATVFLYFGLIRPYKNVPTLISTFREIDHPDARLLIVGNPWTAELSRTVETLAERDERIDTYLDYIPTENVQQYMNAADVVVLPFESVLTSGSAILGMSFGRALIVPNRGCVGELLDDRGAFRYDPADEAGLLSAMTAALSAKDDLAAMGAHNLAAVTDYDWQRIATETRDIYRVISR